MKKLQILCLVFCVFPSSLMAQSTLTITGHRGAAGHAPENTMAAVRKGLALGAGRIEIDVHQTADGQVVVLHDRDLSRTTGFTGNVDDYTYEELKTCKANAGWEEAFPEEGIPLLKDVLAATQGKAVLLIEVKEASEVYPKIEQHILDIVQEAEASDSVILQSFRDEVLETFRDLGAPFPLHKLFMFKVWGLPLLYDGHWHLKSLRAYPYVDAFASYHKFTGNALIRHAHRQGKKLNVWTVNEPSRIRRIIQRGADGIISDYPGRVAEVWQAMHPGQDL